MEISCGIVQEATFVQKLSVAALWGTRWFQTHRPCKRDVTRLAIPSALCASKGAVLRPATDTSLRLGKVLEPFSLLSRIPSRNALEWFIQCDLTGSFHKHLALAIISYRSVWAANRGWLSSWKRHSIVLFWLSFSRNQVSGYAFMDFWNHRGFKLSVYYARGYWYVHPSERPHNATATCPGTTAVLQNSLLSTDKL